MLKRFIFNALNSGYTENAKALSSAPARENSAKNRLIFGVYPAVFTQGAESGAMGMPVVTTEKQAELERLAVVSTWAFADIRIIAMRLANMEWLAERRIVGGEPAGDGPSEDGTKDVKEHDSLALLRHPHPFWSGEQVWEDAVFWYLLRGNSYLFISTPAPGYGLPQEIWPIPADKVRPLPQTIHDGRGIFAGTLVVDFEVNIAGQIKLLPGENVLHWRTANPFDNWLGLSPLNGVNVALQTDYNQGQWLESFFGEDNAVPANIVSVPAELGDLEFKETARRLREEFAGKRRTAIIRAGEIGVQAISQTLHEMEMTQGRAFTREQIDRNYLIPPEIFGGSGGTQAEIVFGRNVLQPLARGLISLLNQRYMPYWGDVSLRLKVPRMIPADRAMDVQEFSTYSKARTVNEAREVLGLPPVTHPLADVPGEILTYEGQAYVMNGGGGMGGPGGAPGPQDMAGGIPDRPDSGIFGISGGTPAGGGKKPPVPPAGETGPNLRQGAMTGVFDIGDKAGQTGPKHDFRNKLEGASKSATIVSSQLSSGGAVVPRALLDAQRIATDAEIKRWRKVAKRALRNGGRPEVRDFTTTIIPEWAIDFVYSRFPDARTPEDIDVIFDELQAMLEDPRYRDKQIKAATLLTRVPAYPIKSLSANWRIIAALQDEDESDSVKASAHVRGYYRTDPRTGRRVFVREYDRSYQGRNAQEGPGRTKKQLPLPTMNRSQNAPQMPTGERGAKDTQEPISTSWGMIPAWAIPKLGGSPDAAIKIMDRLMSMKVGKARASEPHLTAILQSVANSTGGELHGLEYRLKSPDSIFRKFFSDALPISDTPEEAMNHITDAVRYTIVFPNDSFVDNVIKTQKVLADQGWVQYDHKWKNYFGYHGTYAGYNTVYRNKRTGELMEVQFHTPETIAVKPKSHLLYEKARILPEGPERTKLQKQMIDMWNDIPRPPGWERLPGTTFGSFTKSASLWPYPATKPYIAPTPRPIKRIRQERDESSPYPSPRGENAPDSPETPPVGGGVSVGGGGGKPQGGSQTNFVQNTDRPLASTQERGVGDNVSDVGERQSLNSRWSLLGEWGGEEDGGKMGLRETLNRRLRRHYVGKEESGAPRGAMFWINGDDAGEWSDALNGIEDDLLEWIRKGGKG